AVLAHYGIEAIVAKPENIVEEVRNINEVSLRKLELGVGPQALESVSSSPINSDIQTVNIFASFLADGIPEELQSFVGDIMSIVVRARIQNLTNIEILRQFILLSKEERVSRMYVAQAVLVAVNPEGRLKYSQAVRLLKDVTMDLFAAISRGSSSPTLEELRVKKAQLEEAYKSELSDEIEYFSPTIKAIKKELDEVNRQIDALERNSSSPTLEELRVRQAQLEAVYRQELKDEVEYFSPTIKTVKKELDEVNRQIAELERNSSSPTQESIRSILSAFTQGDWQFLEKMGLLVTFELADEVRAGNTNQNHPAVAALTAMSMRFSQKDEQVVKLRQRLSVLNDNNKYGPPDARRADAYEQWCKERGEEQRIIEQLKKAEGKENIEEGEGLLIRLRSGLFTPEQFADIYIKVVLNGYFSEASMALNRFGARGIVASLHERANHKNEEYRVVAINALEKLGLATQEELAVVRSMALQREASFVSAAQKMSRGQNKGVVPLVKNLWTNSKVQELVKQLETNRRALTGKSHDGYDYGRLINACIAIIRDLGQLGNPSAVPILVGMLEDEDFSISEVAAESLEKLNALTADLKIKKYTYDLRSRNLVPAAKIHALEVLADTKEKRVVPLFFEALKDKDTFRAAARLLGDFRDAKAVLPLIEALKNHGYQDLKFCRTVAASLSMLSRPGPINDLIEKLKSTDNEVRFTAAEGLIEMFRVQFVAQFSKEAFDGGVEAKIVRKRAEERAEEKRIANQKELVRLFRKHNYTLSERRFIKAIAKVNAITPLEVAKRLDNRLAQGFADKFAIGKLARAAGLSTRIPDVTTSVGPSLYQESASRQKVELAQKQLNEHGYNIVCECLEFLPSGEDRIATLRKFEVAIARNKSQYQGLSKKIETVFAQHNVDVKLLKIEPLSWVADQAIRVLRRKKDSSNESSSSPASLRNTYILVLRDNENFISAIVDYVERYIAIQKGILAQNLNDHYIDFTGESAIGISLPEEEGDNNVYLNVGDEQRLIFSKDLEGFSAYESEVPVFIKISENREILAVYISINDANDLLELKITRGKDADSISVDPRRLILRPIDEFPYQLEQLYVHASIVAVNALVSSMDRNGDMASSPAKEPYVFVYTEDVSASNVVMRSLKHLRIEKTFETFSYEEGAKLSLLALCNLGEEGAEERLLRSIEDGNVGLLPEGFSEL
ncbi:MAG: hypothetical protein WCY12_06630, partial [Candidatus Omnitrophota bacterium]